MIKRYEYLVYVDFEWRKIERFACYPDQGEASIKADYPQVKSIRCLNK